MLQFRRTVQLGMRMEPPTERPVSVNVLLVELLNHLFSGVIFIRHNS